MKKKTLLIDVRPLMHGNYSGVEVYVIHLLQKLLPLLSNFEVVLWYNSSSSVDGVVEKSLSFVDIHPHVRFLRTTFPNKLVNIGFRFLPFFTVSRVVGFVPDLVFMPDPRPIRVSSHSKLLTTFHDLSFELFSSTFHWKTKLWHKLLAPHFIARSSDALIAVSQATKDDLVKTYALPPSKVHVIYEAASLESPAATSLYSFPYFVMLSTLEPRKNIAHVVSTFLHWKKNTTTDLQLVVIGRENASIFSSFSLPEDSPHVHFTGFVSEPEKATLLLHARALLYVSLYEGFGLPLVEAMSLGTPVVTSSTSSMPEILGEGGLLVDPFSSKELCKAFDTLAFDPLIVSQLAKKAQKRSQNFSWDLCAKQTFELIQTIL